MEVFILGKEQDNGFMFQGKEAGWIKVETEE